MAEEPAKPSKRRVKNPETFRERALKAAETTAQPNRRHRVREGVGKPIGAVVRPVRHTAGRLATRQPFKFLVKVLRLIGKIVFPTYFRNSWRELKLVTWPTKTQSRRLTFAVLAFATVFGAVIALVDLGLDKLFKQILLK